jgi:hypothetical protein
VAVDAVATIGVDRGGIGIELELCDMDGGVGGC